MGEQAGGVGHAGRGRPREDEATCTVTPTPHGTNARLPAPASPSLSSADSDSCSSTIRSAHGFVNPACEAASTATGKQAARKIRKPVLPTR